MTSSPLPGTPSTTAKTPVLVVDDDESFREVMAFHLREEGHEVDCAADALEALRSFDENSHPVVVTDLKMPGTSGLVLMQLLKERAAGVLVIVVTALTDAATEAESMKAGAFDFLPKPCDRARLKLAVRRALEHGRHGANAGESGGRLRGGAEGIVTAASAPRTSGASARGGRA